MSYRLGMFVCVCVCVYVSVLAKVHQESGQGIWQGYRHYDRCLIGRSVRDASSRALQTGLLFEARQQERVPPRECRLHRNTRGPTSARRERFFSAGRRKELVAVVPGGQRWRHNHRGCPLLALSVLKMVLQLLRSSAGRGWRRQRTSDCPVKR